MDFKIGLDAIILKSGKNKMNSQKLIEYKPSSCVEEDLYHEKWRRNDVMKALMEARLLYNLLNEGFLDDII